MINRCDLCSKKMSEKEKSKGGVCLTSEWETFFCKKCYPKILKVIEEAGERYKEFHKKRSNKDFGKDLHFWYKLQEWAYIEFILNYRLNRMIKRNVQ